MRKILFLDVDGVLNHDKWFESEQYRKHQKNWKISMFDPKCVERVNRILNETGAELVVSSSWRSMHDLNLIFENVGLPTKFDVTPYGDVVYNLDPFGRNEDGVDECLWWRGSEIKYWLEHNAPNANYVILDDDADMLDEQIEHFIQTCGDSIYSADLYRYNEGSGLTDKCVERAIKILNNEIH